MPKNLHEAVSDLIVDTKGSVDGPWYDISAQSSLGAFTPELILCVTIVLLLLVRLFDSLKQLDRVCDLNMLIALVGTAAAFLSSIFGPTASFLLAHESVGRMEIFTGMLVYDTFGIFIRAVLFFFAFAFVIFTKLSGIPDKEDGPDIYTLVLGATLGMCLMATANHLLMVFMAVEMASVPSYVLAGLMKGKRVGSEAALKYSIYGAGAAGVMLYGISLIAGLFNTAHLPTIAERLSSSYGSMAGEEKIVLALAGMMIMVGLAFKLSAVPFHFWCPDVFEGAAAEVNAFLSVASKAAALALLIRVAIGFGTIPPESTSPAKLLAAASAVESEEVSVNETAAPQSSTMYVSMHHPGHSEHDDHGSETSAGDNLAPIRDFIAKMLTLFAIVTCTFGNLAAYGQTNIKRLMAYSTIAHAGYMMMPVPVVLAMAAVNPSLAQGAVQALCIYIGIYVFMNLGAFAIIAFLRNDMHSEEIDDYRGLVRQRPVMVVCFAIILFSLIGLPPLAGFIGKFAIFASLANAYTVSAASGAPAKYLLVLLIAGGINTAISLFYYLRVAKVMTLDPEPEGRGEMEPTNGVQGAFVFAMALATVLLFFSWSLLSRCADIASRNLF